MAFDEVVGFLSNSGVIGDLVVVLSRSRSVIVFDEGEGLMSKGVICDLIGVLRREARIFFFASLPFFCTREKQKGNF